MKNEILDEIKKFAKDKLKSAYEYCGVAEGGDIALLNSDDGKGGEIKINIELFQRESSG